MASLRSMGSRRDRSGSYCRYSRNPYGSSTSRYRCGPARYGTNGSTYGAATYGHRPMIIGGMYDRCYYGRRGARYHMEV